MYSKLQKIEIMNHCIIISNSFGTTHVLKENTLIL